MADKTEELIPSPRLAGIHHVKLPVTDLARSRAWYERVFGFRHSPVIEASLGWRSPEVREASR